jgi:hypothetical protein
MTVTLTAVTVVKRGGEEEVAKGVDGEFSGIETL